MMKTKRKHFSLLTNPECYKTKKSRHERDFFVLYKGY